MIASLAATAAGLAGVGFVWELWQFIFLWGVVLGIATAVAPSLGPSVASRWFVSRRGLALGILTNAMPRARWFFCRS